MATHPDPITIGKLEEIGLYNLLTRVAQGRTDVDPFVLVTLREKGFISPNAVSLTEAGVQTLQGLTEQLGWFYPEVEPVGADTMTNSTGVSSSSRIACSST